MLVVAGTQLHSFLTWALHWGEWSASHPSHLETEFLNILLRAITSAFPHIQKCASHKLCLSFCSATFIIYIFRLENVLRVTSWTAEMQIGHFT
jgi:hypothetical protein